MAKVKKSKKNKNLLNFTDWFEENYPDRRTIKGILVMVPSYTCKGVNILRTSTMTIVRRENNSLEGHVAEGEIILPEGYDKEKKLFVFNKRARETAKNKSQIVDNITKENRRICKIVNIDMYGSIVNRPRKRKREN